MRSAPGRTVGPADDSLYHAGPAGGKPAHAPEGATGELICRQLPPMVAAPGELGPPPDRITP